MNRILVLGSLNIDLVQSVPRLPELGETLSGDQLHTFVGGKGANQACAAARLGASVRMAGKVGDDVFAARLLKELQSSGVDTSLTGAAPGSSGIAIIFVLPGGENTIVISPGANAEVDVPFALHAVESLQPGDFLLCQLEVPLPTVEAALKAAYRQGVVTMLDPAPASPLSNELLSSVSILTPNQTEAAILLHTSDAPRTFDEAADAARLLQSHGAHTVVMKLGALGCLLAAKGGYFTQCPGFSVQAVDTTAAGDTFNGALAAALAQGVSLSEGAQFANAAAALSVTRRGTIASLPDLSEVQSFLSAGALVR